jgi:hypothetical protein
MRRAALVPSGASFTSRRYFSQIQEASSGTNKYMQIFNPTNGHVSLSGYFIGMCSNGCSSTISSSSTTTPFESTYAFPTGAAIAPGGFYTICHSGLAGTTTSCDVRLSSDLVNFNGDDFRALCSGSPSSYTIVDQLGVGGGEWVSRGAELRIKSTLQPFC